MKVLVIILAYNEQYNYIVVNDGSRDKTADICRKNGYNMLDFPVNLGLAGGSGGHEICPEVSL